MLYISSSAKISRQPNDTMLCIEYDTLLSIVFGMLLYIVYEAQNCVWCILYNALRMVHCRVLYMVYCCVSYLQGKVDGWILPRDLSCSSESAASLGSARRRH